MSTSRLEILLQYYKDDPNDPFNAYALAIAYLASDRSRAREFFNILISRHPAYLPTYYHAAKFFQDEGQHETAAALYQKGMELARERNDAKALRELQSAYNEMLFD